jgi:hypothetical protein
LTKYQGNRSFKEGERRFTFDFNSFNYKQSFNEMVKKIGFFCSVHLLHQIPQYKRLIWRLQFLQAMTTTTTTTTTMTNEMN